MRQQDFTTKITVRATAQQVFDAINNVRGWWSENIQGDTTKSGSVFIYRDKYLTTKIRITELNQQRIEWLILEATNHYFENKTEWKGTKIIFDISENNNTKLVFTHQGLVPAQECYEVCGNAWTHYIQDSLKSLIVTGNGNPTAKDKEDPLTTMPSVTPEDRYDYPAIHHRLLINQSVEKVYEAITTQEGLSGWWTPNTVARPEVGSVLKFTFEPEYTKEMQVEALHPYRLVKWRCLKAYEDWIGTSLIFELEPHVKGTVLIFHHQGWKNYNDHVASCSFDWALFLRSMRLLCETGKGTPYPRYKQ